METENSQSAANPESSAPAGLDPSKSIIAQAMADGEHSSQATGEENDSSPLPASPAEYKFEFSPETKIDEKLLNGFQQWAHKAGIPMDKARELVGMYEAQMATQVNRWQEELVQRQLGWREDLHNDPDFLRHQEKNFADIRRGMKAYNSKELQKAMEETGLIDHPDMVRHFMRLGRELSEPPSMRGGSSEQRDPNNYEMMKEAGWPA